MQFEIFEHYFHMFGIHSIPVSIIGVNLSVKLINDELEGISDISHILSHAYFVMEIHDFGILCNH